jgi:hypothetical protein
MQFKILGSRSPVQPEPHYFPYVESRTIPVYYLHEFSRVMLPAPNRDAGANVLL